jgi:4-coumarate--CoA ligase
MISSSLRCLKSSRAPWHRTNPRILSSKIWTNPSAVVADKCNLNIVGSPFPDIDEGPYPPLKEFVTANWGVRLLDKVAVTDGSTGMQRTFGEYDELTQNISAALVYDYSIREDSTVALFAPNHVDYLPISLAVSVTGAKLTPINPLYTRNELSTVLKRSRTSLLIVHELCLDVAMTSALDCPLVKNIIVVTDNNHNSIPFGTISLEDLKAKHSKGGITGTMHNIHRQTETHPFLLPYSSGTTAHPKGVCLTHHNLVANLLQIGMVEDLGFPESHKLVSPLPMFHIYAYTFALLYCAWKGHELITMSARFDLERFCQLVEEHKPERAHLVPPIILGMAKSPIIDKYDCSSLRQIVSAAAPLGIEVELAAKARLGCEIKQAWGMSEISPIGTLNSDSSSKPGSVGPLCPSTHAKVVDFEGKSLPPHVDGELLVKGPQVMMGYLDDPEQTRECLSASGWLRTGDICHYDDEGYFFITDRLKELIKVRGYQVAPAELEALLLTHDDIDDAAVIQIPDEESGELPRAYVVLKDGVSTTEQDVMSWVKERVAPYKRLEGGVVLTTTIPKSASGKILRRVLRDQYASEE